MLQVIAGRLDNVDRCNMAVVCYGWKEAVFGDGQGRLLECWGSGREEVVLGLARLVRRFEERGIVGWQFQSELGSFNNGTSFPRHRGDEPGLLKSFWKMHKVLSFSAEEVARTNVLRYAMVVEDNNAGLVRQILATWPGLGAKETRSKGLLLFAVEYGAPEVLEALRVAGFFAGARKHDFQDLDDSRVMTKHRHITWAVLELILSSPGATATLRDVASWCCREPGDIAAHVLKDQGGAQTGQYGAALARLRRWGLTVHNLCSTRKLWYVLHRQADALREVVKWGFTRLDAAKLDLLRSAVLEGNVEVLRALFEERLVVADDVLADDNDALITAARLGNVEVLRFMFSGVVMGGLVVVAADARVKGRQALDYAVRNEQVEFVRELFRLGLVTREDITQHEFIGNGVRLSGWVFRWLEGNRYYGLVQMLLTREVTGVTREDVVAQKNRLVRSLIGLGDAGAVKLLRHIRTEFGLTEQNIPRPGETLEAYATSWPDKTDADVLAFVTELMDGWGLGRQKSQRSQRTALAKVLRVLEERAWHDARLTGEPAVEFPETGRYLRRKDCWNC